ncbi:MAG: DUF4350 domain-containing protein [Candidatus Thermoplasmatota archaeon]|jgi:hypothetical protein|nr:DUF4350 domain-containing protein [Candidatus Thermoplasmatota archaeon]MEC7493736.1 DUF4350 domain-containing protein [Candidatus Thermoplasmatota archaeon]MEC7977245.1 DUF4350 domain-containing protein [Candidatus Thermoplasmatota archaeon]MEC8073771.1 DUF4350 domain-containing protein [Candidatus Thermoplasmatota archaeon]MEC8076789.1 DUF4350 domain-containing protein [Candidatus Thermoplasmatota archaeon]|tara:strand:+ start:3787 stop:5091 length:1305 start_codon:yes stop_codon:yes gene_type:complete
MKISSRSGIIILFATVTVCTLVLFPLLQYVAERDPQLSAYDDDWNDISNFRKSLEEDLDSNYNVSAVLSNPGVLDEISNPSSTLFVIVGTESPYSSFELEILAKYMENGGSILVFGDFDYSDTIAQLFAIEFVKHRLWDQNYRDNLSLIPTTAIVDGESYNILLNEPVAIRDLGSQYVNFWSQGFEWNKKVFISTSKNSWIDTDDDGLITPEDEVSGPQGFTVGMRCEMKSAEGVQLGTAVFVSDSSLPINMMWNEDRNADFLLGLVESIIGPEGDILFDESRHTQESFGASLFQSALGFYFFLAGDTLFIQVIRLNVLVSVIILTMGLSMRQAEPKRWYHIFDIRKPRPLRSYGHSLDKGILALQDVFLERLRLKYQIYEFDDKSRNDRMAMLPNVLNRYNVALDEDIKMLLGNKQEIRPDVLRGIAKKLSAW